jgi:hypothetical protein
MGNNSFATWSMNPNCFIVMNISSSPRKTIMLFNYPINCGGTRDLIKIPGVSEESIRASLSKGELNHKIRAGEITVLCSDIDLTQYNLIQEAFLMSAGIVNGLGPSGGGELTPTEHEILRQLIHFIDEGPGDGFASGAFKVILPAGAPFPTSVIWYLSATMTQKLVEKFITYNSMNFPITILWNMYDVDGVTIVHTVVDTITYSGAFETSRTRAIS